MINIFNLEPYNSKIRQLKIELEDKNKQIYNSADRIELLEDNIMELEQMINNKIDDPLYQKFIDTKVNILVKRFETLRNPITCSN